MARFPSLGVEFEEGPHLINRTDEGEEEWMAFFRDPDGNILAIASVLPLREGIDLSAVAEGMEMMGAGSTLYPALTLSDLAMANSVVIVLGLVTSLLPAWRASQYKPVEAIAKT